jgi:hypothetical protein
MIHGLRKPFVDQAKWDHPEPYPDEFRWSNYRPTLWVIHWGGVGPYRVTTTALAKRLAKGWRDFHVNSRGWYDIAYNRMAWYPPLRLRGENHNGAHVASSYWGGRTRAVVFPVGSNDPIPHRRMLKGFACMWIEDPGPVTDHGSLPPTPGGAVQSTQCSGSVRSLMEAEFWFDTLGTLSFGQMSGRVRSLRRRLRDLGYWEGNDSRLFTRKLRKAVKRFQFTYGLKVTGKVRKRDWKALGNYEGES